MAEPTINHKRCRACNLIKPFTEFHKDRGKPASRCASCVSAKKLARYQSVIEQSQIEGEEWRVIKGHEDYAVSNLGRIRRVTHFRTTYPGRILKSSIVGGYARIDLGTRCRSLSVHGLVARAFIGERPVWADVNHKNGIRTDNRVENLEYVTRRENLWHARLVLGKCTNILSEQQVRDIRQRYAGGGITHKALAREFGVSKSTIGAITRRDNWAHLS